VKDPDSTMHHHPCAQRRVSKKAAFIVSAGAIALVVAMLAVAR
jgi:hypothetical protein